MPINHGVRCRLCRAIVSGWTAAGGKGGSGTVSATIPNEMKPLISNSVQGVIPLQANAFSALSQPFAPLQIAPMTNVEQGLYNAANYAMPYIHDAQPGFYRANQAMDFQLPINQLAATQVATPKAETDLWNQGMQGMLLLDQHRGDAPVQARDQFYANMMAGTGLTGQRVGEMSQEQMASSALQSLPGVAGQPITTPDAETQALAQIANLTGGPLGMAPATQQAIGALERQYSTRSLPALQNQLAQAGLGRSGALEQGVADLQGQLLAAEVPLLQQEIATRERSLPILQDIAGAQTGRQTGSMDRIFQALNAQASGLTNLGGQLGGRAQTDLQRDLAARLGFGSQLGTQQQIEEAARAMPIDRELSYLQSTFNPFLSVAAQQQARSQIPIDRQIQTALQAAPAFVNIGQGESALVKDMAQVGALPRQQQQAEYEALLNASLRQQGLNEAIALGPLDVLPSLLGSKTTTSSSGLFGS